MKRFLLASSILFGSLATGPQSRAVVVVCANCSEFATQLFQQAQAAQSLISQAAQLKTALNQYSNMVTQGLQLPQSIWSNVVGDINQVRQLANAASLLAGNSGSIMTRLQSAQAYAGQAAYLPENIGQQFTMWQQTLGNAGSALGRTLAVQQQQQVAYAGQQQQISVHSQTAAGQMQAIQAGNETLGLVSTQMNQLQTTVTAAAQEQATRDIVAADRNASEDASRQRFLQSKTLPITGAQY